MCTKLDELHFAKYSFIFYLSAIFILMPENER